MNQPFIKDNVIFGPLGCFLFASYTSLVKYTFKNGTLTSRALLLRSTIHVLRAPQFGDIVLTLLILGRAEEELARVWECVKF